MNKNGDLIFTRKILSGILANIFSGIVFCIFFPFWILIPIILLYISINFIAIVIKNTKKMILIIVFIDGLFFIGLLIILISIYIFIDEAERNSHGFLVIYPTVLSIIYFSIVFIRGIITVRKIKTY